MEHSRGEEGRKELSLFSPSLRYVLLSHPCGRLTRHFLCETFPVYITGQTASQAMMSTLLKNLPNTLKNEEKTLFYNGKADAQYPRLPIKSITELDFCWCHFEIYQQWSGLSGLLQIKLYLSTPFIQECIVCIYYVPMGYCYFSKIKPKTASCVYSYLTLQRNKSSRDVNVTKVI